MGMSGENILLMPIPIILCAGNWCLLPLISVMSEGRAGSTLWSTAQNFWIFCFLVFLVFWVSFWGVGGGGFN